MTEFTALARDKAADIVRQCISPIGLRASALDSGYPQVWARDSMITLLGATQLPGADMQQALKQSLITLGDHQTEQGAIPSNVGVHGGRTDFRAYMDGNMWYVIGQHAYYEAYGDTDFLRASWPRIEQTFNWLLAQDVYQNGLVAMQEAADWMDQISIHGLGLCINVLYYRALTAAADLARALDLNPAAQTYDARAERVRTALQRDFWVDMAELATRPVSGRFEREENDIVWGRKLSMIRERPYFLPYLGFRDLGHWFDALGNLLAVLCDVATPDQAKQILAYVKQVGAESPYPVKAIYPTIYPGDKDWRDYYYNRNLNAPNQYHNGGIWPFIGGFYVAALVKTGQPEAAEEALASLAKAGHAGKDGEWEFNEWLHGVSGQPMGQPFQAWSAAMYVFAADCVKTGDVPFFNQAVPVDVK